MNYEYLLTLAVQYLDGKWFERDAYKRDERVVRSHPSQWDIMEQAYPPQKIGLTLNDITQGSETITEQDAFLRVNHNIADSCNTQVAEFCSGRGIRFGYGFAKRHPNTNIILVDKNDKDHYTAALYKRQFARQLRAFRPEQDISRAISANGFERYDVEVPHEGTVPDIMSALFRANNVPNMTYTHQYLTENPEDLQPYINQSKKLYCVGWNCPDDSGIYALRHAVHYNAQAIALTISGLESYTHTTPLSSNAYLHTIFPHILTCSRANPATHNAHTQRYKYHFLEHRKLGFALKHIQILDMLIWLEEQGYSTKLTILEPAIKRTYNCPEHFIRAFRTHDILAPLPCISITNASTG